MRTQQTHWRSPRCSESRHPPTRPAYASVLPRSLVARLTQQSINDASPKEAVQDHPSIGVCVVRQAFSRDRSARVLELGCTLCVDKASVREGAFANEGGHGAARNRQCWDCLTDVGRNLSVEVWSKHRCSTTYFAAEWCSPAQLFFPNFLRSFFACKETLLLPSSHHVLHLPRQPFVEPRRGHPRRRHR